MKVPKLEEGLRFGGGQLKIDAKWERKVSNGHVLVWGWEFGTCGARGQRGARGMMKTL